MPPGDGRARRWWCQGAQQVYELIVAEAKVRQRAQRGAVGEFGFGGRHDETPGED